ncbi:hypothetical protein BKA62DRAFT_79438 [Auriculariales sp. MPI-PUGE-AT-0066]|nr:hypothetical protein BKA62DRAFT_79438 [Auriculariales sp. MPI-PUGE-AT-0066]
MVGALHAQTTPAAVPLLSPTLTHHHHNVTARAAATTTGAACVPQADKCCKPEAMSWMNNDEEQNPCQTLQSLMQTCAPTFKLDVLNADLACPLTLASGAPNPCCCSTVSFTLFAACFMCQSHAGSVSTYYQVLSTCGAGVQFGRLPDQITPSQSAALDIPPWAFMVPEQFDSSWNSTAALQNATLTTEAKTADQHPPSAGIGAGAVAAIIVSLVIAIFLVVFFYLFRVRRQRHRRNGSAAPLLSQPNFTHPPKQGLSSHFKSTQTNTATATMVYATVDLVDEIDAPSLHEPGAPRVPWDHGRKLPVTKYDVQRDEYGQVQAVRQMTQPVYFPGTLGPGDGDQNQLNVYVHVEQEHDGDRWSRARSDSDPTPIPPPLPPKPLRAATHDRRGEPTADSRPRPQRKASRKPAPSVTPSMLDQQQAAILRNLHGYIESPKVISPEQRLTLGPVMRSPELAPDHFALPTAGPSRLTHKRQESLPAPPPPPKHAPPTQQTPLLAHALNPPALARPHMRDRARAPLVVRNSNLSSLGSTASTATDVATPLPPSTQFLQSISHSNGQMEQQLHPYHLPDAVALGIAERRPPDSFALGPPHPTSTAPPSLAVGRPMGPRPNQALAVMTDMQALHGYGLDSTKKSRQLPPVPLPLGSASPPPASRWV